MSCCTFGSLGQIRAKRSRARMYWTFAKNWRKGTVKSFKKKFFERLKILIFRADCRIVLWHLVGNPFSDYNVIFRVIICHIESLKFSDEVIQGLAWSSNFSETVKFTCKLICASFFIKNTAVVDVNWKKSFFFVLMF